MRASYLIAGLGNPGSKYDETRHNIGFMVVDELLRKQGCRFEKKRSNSIRYQISIDGTLVMLLKPTTFMNNSGEAVLQASKELDLPLENLLVVLDDFNLPFGKIRIKPGGSAGGHNGLTSVISCLKNDSFPRLRIGIGQETVTNHVNFVLGRFNREERSLLPEIVDKAAQACIAFVQNGVNDTMTQFN